MLQETDKLFPRTMTDKICDLLIARERLGATIDETAQLLGTTPNAISGRFTELRKDGFITHKLGLDAMPVMRKTRLGKLAAVFVANYENTPF